MRCRLLARISVRFCAFCMGWRLVVMFGNHDLDA